MGVASLEIAPGGVVFWRLFELRDATARRRGDAELGGKPNGVGARLVGNADEWVLDEVTVRGLDEKAMGRVVECGQARDAFFRRAPTADRFAICDEHRRVDFGQDASGCKQWRNSIEFGGSVAAQKVWTT
jgi:hypothetical protein